VSATRLPLPLIPHSLNVCGASSMCRLRSLNRGSIFATINLEFGKRGLFAKWAQDPEERVHDRLFGRKEAR
jgi:hypothetical protein